MRLILSALTLAIGGPTAALVAHHAGLAHALAGVAAALPDPSTAALMFAGLGLVVGARRGAAARADDER